MKRGITVLKMRGSIHDKGIREFTVDHGGMHLGRRFRNVTGVLAGAPVHVSPAELERAWTLHDEEIGRAKASSDGSKAERRGPDRRK